jgi:hypothetical protein
MKTLRTYLVAALVLFSFALTGALAQAQTTPQQAASPTTLQQIEMVQKQIDTLKASAALTTGSIAPPATAPSAEDTTGSSRNEGWIARAHQTGNSWIYGDPMLGAIDAEPMKAFTIKGMSIPLAALANGAKSLPKGQSYAYTLEGEFEVTQDGKFGMTVEITAKTPAKGVVIGTLNYQQVVCATTLVIDNETVIEKDGRIGKERYSDVAYSILGSGRVKLAPGRHRIQATINCAMPAYHQAFGAVWTLKARGPNAIEPTLPLPGFVSHETPNNRI